MIHVNFTEPNNSGWRRWKDQCNSATRDLINKKRRGEVVVITDLYKKYKHVFFKIDENFFGKCIYCESLITSTHPGDVEHFRPKGGVTDIDNKPIKIMKNGIEVDHPGYYWLAYELSNLLPSCEDCNRLSSGNSEGKTIGKWKKFPVNGRNAIKPKDEANEEPLLINPVIEDPEQYLEIDRLGFLHPKNSIERGQTCIMVFGLNDRPSLVDERKRVYEKIRNYFKLAKISFQMNSEEEIQKQIDKIDEHRFGKRPHTIAARKAILDAKDREKLLNSKYNL